MTLILAFVITGAFAQTAIPGEDVIDYVSTDVEATTQVTLGKTIPLYALPDAYYHPSYNPATGAGLTLGYTWTWTPSGGEITLANASDNYVEVTGVTAGTGYTVEVYESGPLCNDASSPESITIDVLNTPTFSITTPALASYEYCVGDASLPATSVIYTITDNGATYYRTSWDLEIYTENASGTPDEWFDVAGVSLGAVQDFAVEYTEGSPQATTNPGTVDITSGLAAWSLMGAGTKTTVYVFTLRSINDIVSRRGDFLTIDGGGGDVSAPASTDFIYYDVAGVSPQATTDVLTITVHPAPVTGPIYHIGNTWAQ